MPLYEYECTNCKFYVEVLQKISDRPLKECPSCKKQTLSKLVSAPVFRLKGGGWYETDFKSEKEDKRNLAEREEAPESKAEEKAEAPKEKEKEKEAAKPAETAPEAKSKKPVKTVAAPAKAKSRAASKLVTKTKPKRKGPAKKKSRR